MTLFEQTAALLPMLQQESEDFPAASLAALRKAGLLMATVPKTFGGHGYDAEPLCALLILLGSGNLAAARLFEAHVNALQLIGRYGTPAIFDQAVQDAAAGHMFGLWVTDPASAGVMAQDNVFSGAKIFCSGAGQASRALITAGEQMYVVNVETAPLLPGLAALSGMKGAITSAVDFSSLTGTKIGGPNDYLREPVFSAGAWRSSAGAVGGLQALLTAYAAELKQRGRTKNAAQRARFGQAMIAYETARLWIFKAAGLACREDQPADAIVAYVNLARLAIERACLDAMQLAQRSLGISAFAAGGRIERLCRDINVFLRQPAPDEALDIAAAYYFDHFQGVSHAPRW